MKTIIAVILLAFMTPVVSCAQTETTDRLTRGQQAAFVEALEQTLRQHYVYQDKVDGIASAINERFQKGAYSNAATASEFADLVTADLINITNDYHFSVIHDPEWIAALRRAIRR